MKHTPEHHIKKNNKTIKKTHTHIIATVTVGHPASLSALSEAEDQLLFCAVFGLYCLIYSNWHTPRPAGDQLDVQRGSAVPH